MLFPIPYLLPVEPLFLTCSQRLVCLLLNINKNLMGILNCVCFLLYMLHVDSSILFYIDVAGVFLQCIQYVESKGHDPRFTLFFTKTREIQYMLLFPNSLRSSNLDNIFYKSHLNSIVRLCSIFWCVITSFVCCNKIPSVLFTFSFMTKVSSRIVSVENHFQNVWACLRHSEKSSRGRRDEHAKQVELSGLCQSCEEGPVTTTDVVGASRS